MPLESIAIGLKLGIDVLEKSAPKGLAWIATKVFGVTMLAVGERRAGKSSFVNYFEHGLLLPVGTRTPRTQEIRNTPSFELSIGREKSLRMRVKKVTDTRGHDTVKEQVSLIVSRRPNILLIFLDVSRNWNDPDEDFGTKYLSSLLEELNTRTLRAKGVSIRMKHLCVVLNKADTANPADYQEKEKTIKGILHHFRSSNWSLAPVDIPTYRCIAVENEEAVHLLDGIIKAIMASVLLEGQ